MTGPGTSPPALGSRDVTVRRAGRGDVHAIAQLWERAELPPSPRGFRNEIARLRTRDPELVIIALMDAQLVGAIAGSYDGRTAMLSRLAVDERVRRRGVGRKLVRALQRQMTELGVRTDELIVLDGSDRADAFWRALGFERGATAAYVVRERQ
jgi:ribosomal protein S18 acetylase RimI-like enzyme